MTKKQLLAWGEIWHYPRLVFPGGFCLRPGEESYRTADRVIVVFASDRIAEWQERYGVKRPEKPLSVDKLLKSRQKSRDRQPVAIE